MDSSTTHYALEDLERLCREKTKEMGEVVGEQFQLSWPPGKGELWNIRSWEIERFTRAYRRERPTSFTSSLELNGLTTAWS